MKIIFHKKYYNSDYAMDPAAADGRLNNIMRIVKSKPKIHEILTPKPASKEDILRAHTKNHHDYIKNNLLLYELSSLAAGGTILAALEAIKGNPSFAVVRPPGHHASANSCWGFCYFNNMCISLLKLFFEGKIKSAFILDFDLHFGDGTVNIFMKKEKKIKVHIINPGANSRVEYINEVKTYLEKLNNIDIFAASAGFDQGINDWGSLLYPDDYKKIGYLMKKYSERLCKGRRYAVLEGGYNHKALGINVDSFCQGFM